MSLEHDSVGYEESEKYEADPAGTNVPESLYHEMTIGRTAYVLQRIKAIWHEIIETIFPVLPTADQKAALDANIRLNGENAVASLADVVDVASAIMFPYTFRTGDTIPVAGEVSFNHADPAQATSVRVSSVNKAGVNVWNHLMKLGENDGLLVQDIDEANKVYNFDIIGPAVDMGDGGYVALPVAMFSQGSEPIGDEQTSIVDLKYDGNNTRFLQKNANLSDLQSKETSRTNLDVYSKGETDGLVSAAAGAAAAAQATADTALANAAAAHGAANAAHGAANAAQNTANAALANAAAAHGAANAAQGTASTALTNAATAQGTASTALTNAATAQSRADAAYSLAESAGSVYFLWSHGIINTDGIIGGIGPHPFNHEITSEWLWYHGYHRNSVVLRIPISPNSKNWLKYVSPDGGISYNFHFISNYVLYGDDTVLALSGTFVLIDSFTQMRVTASHYEIALAERYAVKEFWLQSTIG